MSAPGESNIQVEITDARDFHCFRLVLNAAAAANEPKEHSIEIMLHARSLVDLIHQCSVALCEWQAQTTVELLRHKTGLYEEELRKQRLIR